MYSHLVTVKVGIECRTDERVQLDCLAFDQYRLEGLDTEAVQRRCTIEQDRVLADNLFEDVPDLGALALDQPLGCFDRRCLATQLQLREDKRLEQLERHFLR